MKQEYENLYTAIDALAFAHAIHAILDYQVAIGEKQPDDIDYSRTKNQLDRAKRGLQEVIAEISN